MDHHQVLEFSSEALTDFWLGWIKFEWKWVSFDKKDECHVLSFVAIMCVYCMSYHNLKGKSDIPFWCCLSNEFVKLVELIGLIKGMKIQSYYLSFLITSYNVCEFKENELSHSTISEAQTKKMLEYDGMCLHQELVRETVWPGIIF